MKEKRENGQFVSLEITHLILTSYKHDIKKKKTVDSPCIMYFKSTYLYL